MGRTPAFISYARNDERYATELMVRLRKEADIAPWQDRISMGPGDFEDQIKKGIDGSEYLVLVMTPGALRSPWVEKECRYAREQGRCVVPIKPTFDTPAEDADLEALRATLPLWMQRIQTYDFDAYWKRFVAVLQSPCQATRAPDLSARFGTPIVPRPGEFGRLVDAVLDPGGKNPSGKIVVLHGTGGFGKTTLALSVCHDPDVFAACDGGILWATLGEQPAVLPELEKIYAALTGERPGFATKDDAMIEVAKKLEGKRCLIVIDDVWRQSDLKPFLHGAATSSRLITTRVFTIAAETTDEPNRINVAEPNASEAVAILCAGIAVPPDAAGQFRLLSERLKRVPLLLELANRTLRTQIARPSTVEAALAWAFQRYRDLGVVAYDDQNPSEREDAIAKTVEVSLDFLRGDRQRCLELGVLHEDTDVPFVVLGTLWNLEEPQVQDLVQRLQDFGLIKLNLRERWIHVHDYIREYFARTLPDAALVHGRLAHAWQDLGQLSSSYARRHIVYHLTESLRAPAHIVERAQQLVALLANPRVEDYQRRHGDATALDTNLVLAIARTAESGALEVPGLIASLAVLRKQYASRARDAARVFEAAANGRLSDARQLLGLLDADERWNTVAQLVIAWLAPPDDIADARAIVDEVAPVCRGARLQRALSWVRLMPDGVPAGLPSIGDPPDLETVSAILQRAGGAEKVHGLEPLHMSGIAFGKDQGGFIAEGDAPALVAFANANRRTNSEYVERYIDVHATNRYVHYRNRSLWALLPPILTVPDARWVLRMVQRIATAALTPASIDFEELLPLAVKGVRAAGGDAGGRAFLDDTRTAVRQAAAQLDPKQGRADSWSHLHRRCAALAEIFSLALHDATASSEHLAAAFDLPKGFAGFRAFSALSLAESARIVAPDDRKAFDAALESATAAAHRIQDHQFCLQATSMVNAIKRRWATIAPAGLAATIARFLKNPTASEFCAVHLVGERFAYRTAENEFQALPIPLEVLRASTLREVANAFERDPDNLVKVNGQIWSETDPLDEPLAQNDEINIPDPEFVPVLAARFAAEALVADGITPDMRTQLIQQLTPAALSNPTALDAVLGRLLLSTIGRPTILTTTLQNLAIAPVKDAAGGAEGAYPG